MYSCKTKKFKLFRKSMEKDTIIGSNCLQATLNALHYTNKEKCLWSEEAANGHTMFYEKRKTSGIRGKAKWKNNLDLCWGAEIPEIEHGSDKNL